MEDRFEVVALGAKWVLDLPREAGAALGDHALCLGFGTAALFGLFLAIPPTPLGITLLTVVVVVALGAFGWACKRSDAEVGDTFPIGRLVLLGLSLLLMQAPLLAIMWFASPLLGLLAMGAAAILSAATLPGIGMWGAVVFPVLLYAGFLLAFCFAPHFVAVHRLGVPQALLASLRMWNRNPLAFLAFLGVTLVLGATRVLPLWALMPLPLPGVSLVLSNAIWASGALLMAAGLAAFGRAAICVQSGAVTD